MKTSDLEGGSKLEGEDVAGVVDLLVDRTDVNLGSCWSSLGLACHGAAGGRHTSLPWGCWTSLWLAGHGVLELAIDSSPTIEMATHGSDNVDRPMSFRKSHEMIGSDSWGGCFGK